MQSIAHKKFESVWKQKFRVLPDNETDRASVAWLACYCDNGGGSERYAQQVRAIFDKVFPFSYEAFKDAGFVEPARSWRKWVDREQRKAPELESAVESVPEEISAPVLSQPAKPSRRLTNTKSIKFRALLLGLFTFWHALHASSQAHKSRT